VACPSFNLEGLPFTHDREVNVRRTVHQAVTADRWRNQEVA
jgi:hypothetical protein